MSPCQIIAIAICCCGPSLAAVVLVAVLLEMDKRSDFERDQ